MQVFKLFFKLLNRNKGPVILYMAVFVGVAFIVSSAVATQGTSGGDFTSESLTVGLIDRDHGTLGAALVEYFDGEHELLPAVDEEDSVANELYWRNYKYVLVIPEGFEADFIKAEGEIPKLSCMKVPGMFTASYFESEVVLYLSKLKTYLAVGKSMEEAEKYALELRKEETKVNLASFVNENQNDLVTMFFSFVPYCFISVSCVAVGTILASFNREVLKDRMECGSMPLRRRMGGLTAGILVMGAFLFMVVVILGVFRSGGTLFTDVRLPYFLLNLFAMLLFGLSLGFFTGMVAKNPETVTGICNIAGLGLCFLGGVFVPQQFFGEGVKKAARCVPTYWYVRNNEMIGAMKEPTEEFLGSFFAQIGIVTAYAAALFVLTLVLVSSRRKRA